MIDNLRASVFMMISMAGFAFNDAIVKSLGGKLPATEIMAIRGLFLLLIMLLMISRRRLWRQVPLLRHPLVLLRSLFEMSATILFLMALAEIPFANVSAVLQALPLTVTLGAALFLGERVGWRRWAAILVGLFGVLVIINPAGDSFHPASWYVVGSVIFAAGRDLCTRRVPVEVPSLLMTASTTLLVATGGVLITLLSGSGVVPTTSDCATLFAASLFLGFGYHYIILAMRMGDVAYVVPFRYTSLLWSIALGYLVYAEIPSANTLLGSSIVVSMGLFSLYREIRLARQSRRRETTGMDTGQNQASLKSKVETP